MIRLKCETCSGNLVREGNYLVCESCHNRYVVDVADDINAVARASAWEALRKSDFEKASELFEEIIFKNKKDHEAHWGLALAKNCVVYVTDIAEGKKVPTLNNVSESSFIEDKSVKSAISLAPKEIAESYLLQAEYIEKVRREWLEKASKEPPYDVFISFKDSDRENGIERTNDSQTMQDLYTALVEQGYKVFYSRVTLRDKVSEQYEPYIYNAIKTAKVMIVYGEKLEYFSAPWIKNEWSRFKKRIENGEKLKNSLITVYKGVNPYDISPALTGGKQAIDYAIPSNYGVLLNHIKSVVEDSKKAKGLEKIEIKGGQIGKKSSEIKQETLKTREIGSSTVETSLTDKQSLDLALSYAAVGEFKDAEKMIDELILSNPNNAEIKWHKLKIKHRTDEKGIACKIVSFTDSEIALLKDIVNTANKELASRILDILYDSQVVVNESCFLKILNFILPYNYENRNEKIRFAFEYSIKRGYIDTFKILLTTLQSDSVDEYVTYLIQFAEKNSEYKLKEWCANKILEVDEGNNWAHEFQYQKALSEGSLEKAIERFEQLLKFSTNVDEQVEKALSNIGLNIKSDIDSMFTMRLLRYYGKDLNTIEDLLLKIARLALERRLFSFVKEWCEIAISKNEKNQNMYWLLCLAILNVKDEEFIYDSDITLTSLPEFKKYLALVDANRRNYCIKIEKKQEKIVAEREREQRERRLREKEQEEIEKRYLKQIKAKKIIKAVLITVGTLALSFVIAFLIVLNIVIIPNNKYNEAILLMDNSSYSQAITIFEELGDYKDCKEKLTQCKYAKAVSLMEQYEYEKAKDLFLQLGDYKDCTAKIEECNTAILDGKYNQAVALMEDGKYEEAISKFEDLGDYKDCATKIEECNIAILDGKYSQAVALMEDGKYEEAISQFEDLGDYKDCATKIEECNIAILDGKYSQAVTLMEEGKYEEAYSIFVELGSYKNSQGLTNNAKMQIKKQIIEPFKNCKVGDYIKLGLYEQDNNFTNGKEEIEWQILDIVDGKAFVMSRYGLFCKQYNNKRTVVTWENCSLRTWLNEDFINEAFSVFEQDLIPTVTVKADANPDYETNQGNDTQDKIFILSYEEAKKYLLTYGDKCRKGTPYQLEQSQGSEICWWWLRTIGMEKSWVCYVGDGFFNTRGNSNDYHKYGVCPALWIDLNG